MDVDEDDGESSRHLDSLQDRLVELSKLMTDGLGMIVGRGDGNGVPVSLEDNGRKTPRSVPDGEQMEAWIAKRDAHAGERKTQAAAIVRVSKEISDLADKALRKQVVEIDMQRQEDVEERLQVVVKRASQLLKRVREQNQVVMQAILPSAETPKRLRREEHQVSLNDDGDNDAQLAMNPNH